MSKTYCTTDGETITAETDLRLIEKLRALSRDPEDSLYFFMARMAERVTQQTGVDIPMGPTMTKASFIAGLIMAGLLTEIQE